METVTFALMVGTAIITTWIVKWNDHHQKGDLKRAVKSFFANDFFGINGK